MAPLASGPRRGGRGGSFSTAASLAGTVVGLPEPILGNPLSGHDGDLRAPGALRRRAGMPGSSRTGALVLQRSRLNGHRCAVFCPIIDTGRFDTTVLSCQTHAVSSCHES